MRIIQSKITSRLLAVVLALVMVVSVIPSSIVANAATTENPDVATVTIKDDETGAPIVGAKVTYEIYDNDLGEPVMGDDNVVTLSDGSVKILDTEPGNVMISSITVTHDDYETYTNDAYNQPITSLQDNFDIELTCKKIRNVEITGKTLTYNEGVQDLVSVTEVPGDVVTYKVDGGVESDKAQGTEAKTYSVEVTVTRTGKDPLVKTVNSTINPADLDLDITAKTGLKYDESEQALVEVTGEILDSDTVTWKVDEADTGSRLVPKKSAVGKYKVQLIVDRGSNYKKFDKTVNVEIGLGEIDLGDLKIEANDRTYDTTEQPLLTVTKDGNYTLEYSDDNQATWDKDLIPVATDAGEYVIYVKATKEGYNDKNTPAFPITVTIAKAPQYLQFAAAAPSEVTLGSNNDYNFTATGDNLSNKDVVYTLEDRTATDVATITDNGMVTVANAGIVTVKAFRAGNENYLDAVAYNTVIVKNASTELVAFDSDSETYILDEEGIVSEKIATKTYANDNGTLKYSIDKTNIGLSIDTVTGKITVDNEWELAQAMGRNGSVLVTVTVSKTEGSLNGVKWVFNNNAWNDQDINEKVFAADTDKYTIQIKYAAAPAFNDVCRIENADPVSGWYNSKYPATITPLDANTYTIALDEVHWDSFSNSVTIDEQGTEIHYVHLKNKTTKQISAAIAVNVKVDTVKPEANRIKVEYAKSAMDEFLEVITLGFYNPSVTVRMTAYDVTSGIDYFTWNYTKENGTSTIDHPVTVTNQKVDAVQDDADNTKYTGTFTITADEYNQYRGYLDVTATDNANNTSDVKKDSDNVFVIDTVSPEMSIKYEGEDPYTSEIDAIGSVHYFDGDVAVELTVTEANFYSEDVSISVTKDGQPYAFDTSWGTRNAEDKTVGTFTLEGDGDYVVTVNAKDKSGNVMATYTSETITVDTENPVIDSIYDKNNQTITITVDEHNFRASDVKVEVDAKNIKDEKVDVKDIQGYVQNKEKWINNGDTHTIILKSGEDEILVDAIYKLTINYDDISNNPADVEVTESSLIDHEGPRDVKIEYSKSILDRILEGLSFGFYQADVTVTITAYDDNAGIEFFTWKYTKQPTASVINHPVSISDSNIYADAQKNDATVTFKQDDDDESKFVATFKLTATELEQFRGSIAASATDIFKNPSQMITDSGKIIVVDNVAPKIAVEYTPADRTIGNEYYYNNAVDVKFIVTEANFYPEDVNVSVTKNGHPFDFGTVAWGTRDADDKTIGTFTLNAPADHTGDGHYVITVEYTDKSNNEMVKYVSDTHTIDTTLPEISVDYQNKTVANKLKDTEEHEREYFADTQTAVVTIKEHNFIADEVDFTIVAKDVSGTTLDTSTLHSKSTWTVDSTGDVHTITITYPGDANYTFDVAYTDKATNVAKDYAEDYFSVDKTNPTNLKVEYSTSVLDTVLESLTFGFYNAKMTVTLTAEDPTTEVHSFLYSYLNAAGVSNVNAQLINEAIDAAKITYSTDRKTATVTFEIPKMVLENDNQFNGTVEFTATDRSGNETDVHKETKRIVLDNIAPTAKVEYNEATNVVGDISYYNGDINATVTITEANFYKNDVQVMVSKDGAAATAVTPDWTDSSVDVHVGTFTLKEDGDYIITINYKDKSSNEMATYASKQMTIDTKIEVPTYTVNGVAKKDEGGAYKGDATIGFNFEDQNFDTKTIKLTRTRFDKVEDVTDKFIKVNDNDKGGSGSFTIPSEVDNDGIYVLKIEMADKAKHTTESQIKFTINRFGSVYEYNKTLVDLINGGGQFVKSVKEDLVITEYNADRILADTLNILVTRDGETVDVDFASNPENINAQVAISEGGWYKYVYTIKAATFEKDGVYKISLTSKYGADDSAENESTSVPENSLDEQGNAILDTMSFTVDSVAPEIRNIVNLDKAIADKDKIVDGKLNVKYTIVDVGGLKTIEVIVNGETVKSLTAEEIGDDLYNFTGEFDLAEQDGTSAHKVQIKVTDLAGNVTDTNSDDFQKVHSEDNEDSTYVFFNEVTVSRNFFVRWYANKALFWGTIGGVVVLAGAICAFIAYKRKKKEEK